MIKPANTLPKIATRQDIINFFEDFIMSDIERTAKSGREKMSYDATISVCVETGELSRAFHETDYKNGIHWLHRDVAEYPEVEADFKKNGYWFTRDGMYHDIKYINW